MTKYVLILGVLIFIISCKKVEAIPEGYNLYFKTPQPIHDSELSKFPNRYRGLYVSSDSIYTRIKDNIILSESYTKFIVHKTAMDSLKREFDYSHGNYILKLDRSIYVPKIIGDSIELSTKQVDTIFSFSNVQKAKLVHGQIVLNTKDSIFWNAKILTLNKNTLSLKYLYSKEDLQRMDSITKLKSTMIDSSTYILKPSRREFIKFIELKNFGYVREYKKIRNKH